MRVLTMAKALNDALDVGLEKDSHVLIMGEDVGRTGGVFRITDGLHEKYGEHRVIDGVAFGLAVGGMRPVAELQFMGFSYPAFDQIISHVSRIRNRSQHRFTAPMVIRIPYGGGIGAAEHHSESAEAIYAHTPGLKVVVPSTPYDAKGLLLAAIADPDPVVFCEPIRLYRAVKEDVPEGWYEVPIGEARVEREGNDLTLLSWGAMMMETRKAAVRLAEDGVSAEVIDIRSLVPFDAATVVASVEKTGRAVIVHEAPRTAGFGAEVAATIAEHCLYSLEAPIERVTGWDSVFPLKRSEHQYMPSVERIVAAARQTLEA